MEKNRIKVVVTTLYLFMFMAFSINVNAQEVFNSKFSGDFASPSIDYEQIILVILFLIAFIIIALFLIKKLRYSNLHNQGLIEIIYSYPLSTKEKLLIVKAAQEYLLLGSSAAGIRKLHVLDKEYISSLHVENVTGANDFANIFVNLLGKKDHA